MYRWQRLVVRGWLSEYQFVLVGKDDDFKRRLAVEFALYTVFVGLYGIGVDVQLAADFLAGTAVGEELYDLHFPVAQFVGLPLAEVGFAAESLYDFVVGDGVSEIKSLALCHGLYGSDQFHRRGILGQVSVQLKPQGPDDVGYVLIMGKNEDGQVRIVRLDELVRRLPRPG